MKLIIAGSRTVSPTPEEISNELRCMEKPENGIRIDPYEDITEVVSGTADGADAAGEAWADSCRIPVRRFPAAWAIHGKAAGKLRNREMAEYGDALLAFWDGMSSGTCDMVTRMVARGKPVRVVPMKAGKK